MSIPPIEAATHGSTADKTRREEAGGKRFTLAHFSDPHFARVDAIEKSDLFNKRFLGFLRWKLKRRNEHSDELLTILRQDLQRTKPNHIAITGDLTQLALPIEFQTVHAWLQTIGPAERVTVIPGNHDAYVQTDWRKSFAHWAEYMAGDGPDGTADRQPAVEGFFPSLRIRDRIALIGINTAQPTGLHLATGTIGSFQLQRLETLLKSLAGRDLFRIILIHHPPARNVVSWRRCLTDAASLRMLLQEYGAEMVLFGHTHKKVYARLETPSGLIPVIGAPSASSQSDLEERRSCYFLYEIVSTATGWKVNMAERFFSCKKQCFVDGEQQNFILPLQAG